MLCSHANEVMVKVSSLMVEEQVEELASKLGLHVHVICAQSLHKTTQH